MKKRIAILCSLLVILAAVVFAQTNSGAWRISPGGFFEVSGAQLFETSAGSGGNVGLLGNSGNTLKLTQNDGATVIGPLPAVIYNVTAAQAATGVNAATTITGSSFTPTAGFLNVVGKSIEGEAWLTNINVTGTPTVAIAVKIGATTVATCTSQAITNAVTAPVHFTFTVKTAAIGASGTDEAHCAMDIPLAAAGNAVARVLDNNTAVSSTYDHTAANAIVLVGTSAGASNTLTLRDYRVIVAN